MPHLEFDVFLSHNSDDKPDVLKLATKLKELGLNPWVDAWHLIPGEPWLPAIERALANSDSCTIIIGPNGLGNVHEDEMWVALQRGIESKRAERRFRIIPILLPKAIRGDRARLPTFLTANTWVEFRQSIDDPVALAKLVNAIRGQAPGAGVTLAAGECPYRGLACFDIQHTNFFFGREALTDWLLSRLRGTATQAGPTRFLAIMGASGSGKSSLARAGVLAKLKAGDVQGSERWPIVVCRPESRPLESLATALASLEGEKLGPIARSEMISGLLRSLSESSEKLHLVSRAAMPADDPDWRLVIFVDQFEELFTLSVGEHVDPKSAKANSTLSTDRVAFVLNLLHAATVQNGRTIVILTMRADFYGKCASIPDLANAVSDYQQLVGPMSSDELRRSIETPAQLAGGDIEPGLVDLLVREVVDQPGALPLLQYALAELWNNTRKLGQSKLTTTAYRELGGWEGALSRRADAVLAAFKNTPQERICRELFLRLVQLGEGTEDTKRLVRWNELNRSNPSELEALEFTVRKLVDNRLITTGGDSKSGATLDANSTVEIVHEALIRGWGELRNWLESNRAGLRIHRQLTDAANEWAKSHDDVRKRDPSLLFTGTRLAVASELSKRSGVALNDVESEFLAFSTNAIRRQKRRKILWWVGMAAGIVLLVSLGTGIVQNIKYNDRAQNIVTNLTHANELQVPGLIDELKHFRRWANEPLHQLYSDSPVDSSARLNAALALASVDEGVVNHLRSRLLLVTSAQFPIVRDALKRYDHQLSEQVEVLWTTATAVTVPMSRRFQAACALATYAPDDPRWSTIAAPVAQYLVLQPAAEHVAWRAILSPAGHQLQEPLAAIFRNRSKEIQLRQFAAETLSKIADNNGELLGQLLLDSDPKTFEPLLRAVEKASPDIISQVKQVLNRPLIPQSQDGTSDDPTLALTEEDRDALARRQSHASVVLARLGNAESLWSQLAFKPDAEHPESLDPRLRTELIHDLAEYSVDSKLLFERLRSEQDVSTRRALLLALGHYPAEELPAELHSVLIENLLRDYQNEPDKGLHGAIEWLLRKWDRGEDLRRMVDELMVKDHSHCGRGSAGHRQWCLSGQGQTYSFFPAGEFQMGSPETEPGRFAETEVQHLYQIEKSFLLATTEVTRAQFLVFVKSTKGYDPDNRYVKTLDSPQTGVTWFEAAHYCNWLSEQEGVEENQRCYQANQHGHYGPGMKAKAGFLDLAGYRLPTEAEWEYACRAGTKTSRYYGNNETRLDGFAWYVINSNDRSHPVGEKMPNDAGMFDMLGNAYEWCYDAVIPDQANPRPLPMITSEPVIIDGSLNRALRGASFYPASYVRSSFRDYSVSPDRRDFFFGFRPARTYHQAPK